jgi:hypothetical protein
VQGIREIQHPPSIHHHAFDKPESGLETFFNSSVILSISLKPYILQNLNNTDKYAP